MDLFTVVVIVIALLFFLLLAALFLSWCLRGRYNQTLRSETDSWSVWVDDLPRLVDENRAFRHVVTSGPHTQLTVMRLGPKEEIGRERHLLSDQLLRVETGTGLVEWSATTSAPVLTEPIRPGTVVLVPAGWWHNIKNTGSTDLTLSSLYAPAEQSSTHHSKKDHK